MVPYSHLPQPGGDYLRLVYEVEERLFALADRLRRHWAAHAAALGLSAVQVKVLLRLTPGEPMPMRRLAQQLDYDASNLTTLVDRLEQRGAVQRRADPRDRRVKALALTAEGERLRSRFWQQLTADPGPLAPASQPELHDLARLLAAVEGSEAATPDPRRTPGR